MKHRSKQSKPTKTARDPQSRAVSFVDNSQQPILIRFGRAVRQRRDRMGLTQSELASKAGINRSYLSEVENGRKSISIERAERIAHALQCKLTDLFGET